MKSPSTFGHAGVKDTITRITAIITLANTPSWPAETPGDDPSKPFQNTVNSPADPWNRHGMPTTAVPGKHGLRNVTEKRTIHQGLKAKPRGIAS